MPYYVKIFDKPMNEDESRILNQKVILVDSSAKLVINPNRSSFAPCWIERPDDNANDNPAQIEVSRRVVEIVEEYFSQRGD